MTLLKIFAMSDFCSGVFDCRKIFQRQGLQIFSERAFRLLEHLVFGNPKRGLRDGRRERINFNAVKILNRNFNRVDEFAEDNLVAELF